ncbi:hypothetical protein [Streptomyces cadmiisoli]|uniref:hypothetical protein n=1 Tax=Streptomyces cadmiisoli TaxID=2184053 RepID=UPI00364A86E6
MPRYFVSPDGASFAQAGDGPFAASSVPAGWQEITAEEYETQSEAARQAASERADEFIANDGELPDGGVEVQEGLPLAELRARLATA